MKPRLTTDEIGAIFFRTYAETGDVQAAALAVYEAGVSASEKFLGPRRPPSKTPRLLVRRLAEPTMDAVAKHWGMTVSVMLRRDPINRLASRARQDAVWLLRKRLLCTEIALVMGWENHTSCIYAYRRAAERIAARPELGDELLALVEGAARPKLRAVG